MRYKTKRKPLWALLLLLMLGLVLVLSGMRRHSDTDGLPEALRELYDRNPEARDFECFLPLQQTFDRLCRACREAGVPVARVPLTEAAAPSPQHPELHGAGDPQGLDGSRLPRPAPLLCRRLEPGRSRH